MAQPYEILTPAGLRARYVTLTDRLIRAIEGHEGWRPQELLFLDKSGRPVAWLLRQLWPVLAREPGTRFGDAVVPPLPPTRMVNIDREQWWDLTGASEVGAVDVTGVPDEAIDSLRAVFATRPPRPGEPVADVPAWLDGRRVLVVDEVANTGDTLRIAKGLLARAFPTADLRTHHWMSPGSTRDRGGLARTADVPVWYRADTWAGRLVGNRLDPGNPPHSWRNRAGALFLSTAPRSPDLRGRRLRAEVAWLAADVAAGRLLAAPSPARDAEDWLDRVRGLYGHTDPRQFTQARLADAHAP